MMPGSSNVPAAPLVVLAVVTSDRGVLLARRRDGRPPWTFPGGQAEPGESPKDTAFREVREETGLEVRPGRSLGRRRHPATGRDVIYLAAEPAYGTDVFVAGPGELAEVRWCSAAAAEQLLPGMFGAVREHLAAMLPAERAG